MKTEGDVRALEKLITQLAGMHAEITQLVKKSPNDGLNRFKLSLVNKVLEDANSILVGEYVPFDDFEGFNVDDLPTNSDAAMVLSQYIDQAERYRSNNVAYSDYSWWYLVNGAKSDILAKPPTKVGRDSK
jgi:hypothetical protein